MGKATRWLRSLFSSKKSSHESSSKEKNNKKKTTINWAAPSNTKNSSVNFKNAVEDSHQVVISPNVDGLDANKHAVAVAAATAAVAEAALAAAQAAAEVVKLTSGGGGGSARIAAAYRGGDRRMVLAAVKIQSAFRAYLARRALRALKGLVKLQALVRGHFVRKQSADMLRRMQAMARIQARASVYRSCTTEPYNAKINFSDSHCHQMQHSHSRSYIGSGKESSGLGTNWLNHWMEQHAQNNIQDSVFERRRFDDERSDKILEIDTWKPHQNVQRKDRRTSPSTSQYFSAWNGTGPDYSKTGPSSRLSAQLLKPNPSVSSEEVSSVISPNFPPEIDKNSRRVHSASSRPARGPFTPARSDCSKSLYGDYLSHPNYMANTESSRAKVRSQSAPKQRLQFEELGLNVKYGRGLWESDANSEKSAYVYTGHLKRQATPSRTGFGPTYGYRL